MKYFVISDIHSNYDALKAFADFIKPLFSAGDVLFCLGDLIGYGPEPSECISWIADKCDYVISGNHERMLLDKTLREFANDIARRAIEWADEKLSGGEKSYLKKLPDMADTGIRIILAHGSPEDPDEYILRHSQAMSAITMMRTLKRSICFFGHTHIPGIFSEAGYSYVPGVKINLEKDNYYLINPGSIGQPRDRDSRSSFCILDGDMLDVTFYRIPYDIDNVSRKIKEAGLPIELGERLYFGV
ncbi:MAG: metallophosphoesterase family protein [Brevinematales bacterium]